jgi:hypothetical protein
MRDPLRSTSHRTLRAALAILAAGAGLLAIYSCSLIVDTQSQQCTQDSDCQQFANATCDTATGACVPSATSSGSGSGSSSGGVATCDVDGGIDGGGCYDDSLATCSLSTDPVVLNSELLNGCTTGCVPFDNSARVLGLLAGGQLPPLPSQAPDGGM